MSAPVRVLQAAAHQYAREMASASSFIPDVEAWDPWRPDHVAAALAPVEVRWAVAGGWAIDLHLGEVTRPHEDIEIVVSREDVHTLLACLSELDWFAVGDGRAWPIAGAPQELHQTWGRDRSGQWRLDVLQEPWDDGEWVCRRDPHIRRPLADAIELTAGGIPYLAPEIVLLFKAKAARGKDEADLAITLPSLTPDRISWLQGALRIVHPGHEWLSQLDAEHGKQDPDEEADDGDGACRHPDQRDASDPSVGSLRQRGRSADESEDSEGETGPGAPNR
jgi:hypothetical protein